MSCAFSSQTITSKPKRRSRWGEFRGCPVLSSHLAPGFAPQVGQCLANIRLASRFFIPRLCPREQEERWSVLLTPPTHSSVTRHVCSLSRLRGARLFRILTETSKRGTLTPEQNNTRL